MPAGEYAARDAETTRHSGVTVLAVLFYLAVVGVSFMQQPGRVTYDTRAELTERPGDFLSGAFTLWHADANFGEFQNQAYGLLFPQGAWFWAADRIGMADWVAQRLWTALLIIVACEGARRVGRHLGLVPAAALIAGMIYALSPRLLGSVGVQTGESLPGALMPWLVLAVVLHLRGRVGILASALLSGAAVVAMGGVNAVETAGSLPLAVILVGWAAWHRWVSWRYVVSWVAAVGAACLWWALPLLVLARYSPPFYDFVESAADTTAVVGWSEALRGDSSWIGSLVVGGQLPWWPAAYHLAYDPLLVIVAGVVAAAGLAGLLTFPKPWRGPLVAALALGLTCLTVAHVSTEGAPIAGTVRTLLDGPLAIFRNVHKIDPVVRLPVALGAAGGFALAADAVAAWAGRWRPRMRQSATFLLLLPALAVLVLGRPFLLGDARTPGWEGISKPWVQARDYLAAHADGSTTLIVPGSGFAIEDWGWSLDEPLVILGGTDFVARTQTPLIPGESIRFLASLDQLIATGKATDALPAQLARAGVGHVVLRRDLERGLTGSPDPGFAAVSLATGGLHRDAAFGSADSGAAVEVFDVPGSQPHVRATDEDHVQTVRGAPETVLGLQDDALVGADQATVLENEPGWSGSPQIVTDGLQRRERAFGATDEARSTVLGPDDPWRVDRRVHDYPAGVNERVGGGLVVAEEDGLRSLTASSAQGYADNYGAVVPQSGPYAAVDGDQTTRWLSSSGTDPRHQWIRMEFSKPRAVHSVKVTPVADDPAVVPIREIEVVAGRQRVRASVAPSGVPVTVRLSGAEVSSVEIRTVAVATAAPRAQVGLREVAVDETPTRRTLRLPGVVPAGASLMFGTAPERRACTVTIGVPNCSVARIRPPEEAIGLDRTYVSHTPQKLRIRGTVVARSSATTAALLDPIEPAQRVEATSFYGDDPKVAPRFAYDGQPTTSWVSGDHDRLPTLRFEWDRPHTITSLMVADGGEGTPTGAIVTAGDSAQEVTLLGGAVSALEPIRTTSLSVRFERSSDAPVVVPELTFGGVDVTRPLLADAPTGAVCGLGPRIYVDGHPVDTRVDGTVADVINGSPMRLTACRAKAGSAEGLRRTVRLQPGEHRVAATPSGEFEVTGLALAPRPLADEPPAVRVERAVDVVRWSDDGNGDVTVGAGDAALLWLPENFNAGRRAVARMPDGRSVRLTPLRVDGWAQAWRLPEADKAVRVHIEFGPQERFAVVLATGLAVSGAVLLGGVVALAGLALPRSRRRSASLRQPAGVRRLPDWTLAAAFTVLVVGVLVLLGPAAATGLLLGSLLLRRSQGLTALVVGLAAGAAAADALASGALASRAADAMAAAAVGLVIGAVSVPRRRGRHL